MKWRISDSGGWYPWFAWYPVRIGRQRVWLEWVERQMLGGGFGDYAVYHRLPGGVERFETVEELFEDLGLTTRDCSNCSEAVCDECEAREALAAIMREYRHLMGERTPEIADAEAALARRAV